MDSPNPSPANGSTAKRRRKNDGEPSEPRRLRRSHEACTRCRGKKIKCDSKHPRCTACVTAGVPCNQEDRHRQTTIARDHTERLEQVVAQCDALLKRHIPGFSLENVEDVCSREGLDPSTIQPIQNLPQQTSAGSSPTASQPPPTMNPPQTTFFHPNIGYYQYPLHIYAPPFQIPPVVPPPGQDPKSNDMSSSTQALAKSFGVAPSIVNDTSVPPVPVFHYSPPAVLYNTSGDAPAPLVGPAPLAEEDLAVGSSGLDSGRDRVVQLETPAPRDSAKWRVVSVFRSPPLAGASPMDIWIPNDRDTLLDVVNVYFTRLNPHRPVFFRHQFIEALNQLYEEGATSRPVFDPGFICSLYLVLALGTLSKLNRSGYQGELSSTNGDALMDEDADGSKEDVSSPRSRSFNRSKKATKSAAASADPDSSRLPPDWPAHDEFFDRALAVKPELRVTLSSLQALILLHWYLYAERQGRTLWRLVGSIVRLAIELGLHHDPTTQTTQNPHHITSSPSEGDEAPQPEIPTFTPLECILRIRLWSIVLVHDRGTSILLGRPLAIAPSDANTPRPGTPRTSDPVFTSPTGSNVKPPIAADLEVSEHFMLSAPVAEIQADIIISLYSPSRQSGEVLLRNANRIIKSINLFRRSLPQAYKFYFGGTESWSISKRHELLANLSESSGLTLLKLAISRILLLRALFNSKELSYAERKKALVDAIVQAHNVIAIHTVLVRFPEVGFFTSAVPLHIAAMVILYGRMSKCDEGIPGLSDGEGSESGSNAVRILMEDVWLALDMLPKFRWRWETGSGTNAGTNPLIAKLAQKVMEASFSENGLRGIGPPDESDQQNSTASSERSESRESRLISGIGRQGPIGRPVLIPEPEWEEDAASPNRDKTNTNITSTGSWDHSWADTTASPKSQQSTPTVQAATYPSPSSYPTSANSSGMTYTYPPPLPATNSSAGSAGTSYSHPPQYAFSPPVFGPQPTNTALERPVPKVTPVSSTANAPTAATPTRGGVSSLSLLDVPHNLFYPYNPDTPHIESIHSSSSVVGSSYPASNALLSPPPQSRVPRSAEASGAPIPSNNTNATTHSLVAAVAHAHGGQQGASNMYIIEERGHPGVSAYVALGSSGAYHPHPPHSQFTIPPPPPPGPDPQHSHPQPPLLPHSPSAHLHHVPFAAHAVNGHSVHGPMPPPSPHGVWAPQHASSPQSTGYAQQPP
ncbi:hypothetical protein GYMLUDRAFT_41790 [Collybiopsis luxurians FD-317 M1]|uniref:Zn(2)-C6 fungal-type domain-containing protein n=1 Tax=Collybiopsis luxurians FD-317 M1 TaxID=944289 RepID=A0A0D0CSP0_9AGAR|nr:hypothetical protein GYMLUDRAFT_41790 [Collybiopsis luxurians FD-317 M1]